MTSRVLSTIVQALLSPLFPINMLLKVYSLCILMVDIVWVFTNAICAIVQSAFQFLIPPAMKPVENETAMVIGSGRGVGRELAIQLAELGATVLCVDINEGNNQKTVDYIKQKGGEAYSYTYDITKKEDISRLADQLKGIDYVSMLFYCCGIPSPRSMMTQAPQDIHTTLDLTLTSYFYLIDQFVPAMKEKNHGHIVALTSLAGLSYIKDQMPLGAAQFAVRGVTETLMDDLRISKANGVHVTLVHIYPFIVEKSSNIRLKISSYFGTITPEKAASSILQSVRRNYPEASVPKYVLYLGSVIRILPRKAVVLVRDLLDTGVDFA